MNPQNKKSLDLDQYSWRNQGVKNSIAKRKKTKKFYKISLIYYSKLKSNVIGTKIKKKSYNLT